MSDFEIAMLDSGQGIGFSNCTCFSEDSVEYVIHESGTTVYDRRGHLIGKFATETEAMEVVREIRQQFMQG